MSQIVSKFITDSAVTTAKINNSAVTDAKVATGIDAAKLADGSVSNTEFQYLSGVTSDIQTQIGALAAPLYGKETFTLIAGDITNQYVDLAQVAKTGSIDFKVKGSAELLEGASHDFSVSYTGGAGGKTRITFLNDLATGGAAALVATDVVQVLYAY